MAMRLSGLMSGMDTESIVSQLVEAKKTKVTKAVKAQKSLKYKQDAWKALNAKIVSLYDKALGNMRFESAYRKKTTKVSNSSVVSVITGENAMNSVQSLKVEHLAKTAILTGGKLPETIKDTDEDGNVIDVAVSGSTTLGQLGLGLEEGVTGTFTVKLTNSDTPANITVSENTTINDVVSRLREVGLNVNFDENNKRMFISSKASGAGNNFTIEAVGNSGLEALEALGLSDGTKTSDSLNLTADEVKTKLENAKDQAEVSKLLAKYGRIYNIAEGKQTEVVGGDGTATITKTYEVLAFSDAKKAEEWKAHKDDGEDAVISLNGVEYTSSKNSFEINGLSLTVSATTAANETVTITTEDDISGVYDMIKGFLKDYNALINEMDKLYNADSAKGYEPLTDEEKDAMSDSQIEEWETKIKDSILRKDSSLSTISTAMKTIMLEGVEVNGKKMYLSNFGINTLSYFSAPENEKNAYHIDGDSDDSATSGNADKLKTMIANEPDTVIAFFTKLTNNLREKMFDVMGGTEYSSVMSAYDDKKMQTDYDDYTTKIKELEKKLADYEDKWYAKFAAMETAMAKMQNNASAVTSLLGG